MASLLPRFHIGDKLAETFSRPQATVHEDVLQLEDGRYVGYLEKQGRARNQFSFSAIKSWTLRWIVVDATSGLLEYYTDQRDFERGVHAKGRLHIHGAFLNRLSERGAGTGKTNAFSITIDKHSGERETLVFNALDDIQSEQWLSVFKIAISEGKNVHSDEMDTHNYYVNNRDSIGSNWNGEESGSRYPGRNQRSQSQHERMSQQRTSRGSNIASMAMVQSGGTLLEEGSEDIVKLDNMHGDDIVGGYLYKKGRSRNLSFGKPWSMRFFTVDSTTAVLQYFANQRELENGHQPRGQLSLIGAGLDHLDSEGNKQFCFELSLNKNDGSVENLTLCALSQDNYDSWWGILAHVITGENVGLEDQNWQQYEDEFDDEDYINQQISNQYSSGNAQALPRFQTNAASFQQQQQQSTSNFSHQSQYELFQQHKLAQQGSDRSSASSSFSTSTHPPPPFSPPSVGKMEGKVIDKLAANKMFAPPNSPPGVANNITANSTFVAASSKATAPNESKVSNIGELEQTLRNTNAELERVLDENEQLRKLLGAESDRVKELEVELDDMNHKLEKASGEIQFWKENLKSKSTSPSTKSILPPKSPKSTSLYPTKLATDGIAAQSEILDLQIDHLDDYEIPDVTPSPLPSSKESDIDSLMSPSPSPNKKKIVLSALPVKPATGATVASQVVSKKEQLRLQLEKEKAQEQERQNKLKLQRQREKEEEERRLAAEREAEQKRVATEEAHMQWLAAEKQRKLEEEIAAAEERERIEIEIREKKMHEERLLAKKREEEAQRLRAEQARLETEAIAREKQRLIEEAEKEKQRLVQEAEREKMRKLKQLEEENEREKARLDAIAMAKRLDAEKKHAELTRSLQREQQENQAENERESSKPKVPEPILIEVDLEEGRVGKLLAYLNSNVNELVDRFVDEYSLSAQYKEPLAAYVLETIEATKADLGEDYDMDFEEDDEGEYEEDEILGEKDSSGKIVRVEDAVNTETGATIVKTVSTTHVERRTSVHHHDQNVHLEETDIDKSDLNVIKDTHTAGKDAAFKDHDNYGGLVVDVDLGDGQTGHILLFHDSDLVELTLDFLRKNELSDSYYDAVLQYITECQGAMTPPEKSESDVEEVIDVQVTSVTTTSNSLSSGKVFDAIPEEEPESEVTVDKFESVDRFESPEPLRVDTLGSTMGTISSLGGDSPLADVSYLSTSRVISPSSGIKTRPRRYSIPMSMELTMPPELQAAVNSLSEFSEELKSSSRMSSPDKVFYTTEKDPDDTSLTISPSTSSSVSIVSKKSRPNIRTITNNRRASTLERVTQSKHKITPPTAPPSPPSNDHRSLTGKSGADQVYNFSELSKTGAILPSSSVVNLPVERRNLAGTPKDKGSIDSTSSVYSGHQFGVGSTSRIITNTSEKPIISGRRKSSIHSQPRVTTSETIEESDINLI